MIKPKCIWWSLINFIYVLIFPNNLFEMVATSQHFFFILRYSSKRLHFVWHKLCRCKWMQCTPSEYYNETPNYIYNCFRWRNTCWGKQNSSKLCFFINFTFWKFKYVLSLLWS